MVQVEIVLYIEIPVSIIRRYRKEYLRSLCKPVRMSVSQMKCIGVTSGLKDFFWKDQNEEDARAWRRRTFTLSGGFLL
jgi:hypothetical protein